MRPCDYPELPVEPPAEEPMPVCPCCGAECDTLYQDRYDRVVGCGHCVEELDAWEHRELTA